MRCGPSNRPRTGHRPDVDEPRRTTARIRPRALPTAAAFNYYLAGDAVRVGMAIDRAQDASTAAGLHLPNLADLRSAVVRAGLPPSKITRLSPPARTLRFGHTDHGPGAGPGLRRKFQVGQEDIVRNNVSYMGQQTTQLSNTIARKLDVRAIAELAGRAHRTRRDGRRCPPPAGRDRHCQRHGLSARHRSSSRAQLSEGDAAERWYRESIERLGRTCIRADLARAHLLYGEWLRRERPRIDARAQLHIAHHMLETMGMEAFAERARRELKATGVTARKRTTVHAAGHRPRMKCSAQVIFGATLEPT
jgi:hypothetical protein